MLVNGLNPEVIVVDGEISEAWNIIEPEIWRVLQAKTLDFNLKSLQLKQSAVRENACLMGAVSMVLCHRFAVPKVA